MQANTEKLIESHSRRIECLEAKLIDKDEKMEQLVREQAQKLEAAIAVKDTKIELLREQLRKSIQECNDLRLQQV